MAIWAGVFIIPYVFIILPRRGGGDGHLHLLASRLASLFLRHTLACAKWGPQQLMHLATTCAHAFPLPAKHPSTGHLCLSVWRSPAASISGAAASMWPHGLSTCVDLELRRI